MAVSGDGRPNNPYVISAEAAPVVVGPGLTGDGTPASPIVPAVSDWPYACDVAQAGRVFLDDAGVLRSEPRGRLVHTLISDNQSFPNVVVPAADDTPIVTQTLDITNPDPCRSSLVIFNAYIDVQFDLPAGSGAGSGIFTDAMTFERNTGSASALGIHTQVSKEWFRAVPAGGTLAEPFGISVGKGSGGATYFRAQWAVRAYQFIL